jgi:ketosteroid isomerase-like protein
MIECQAMPDFFLNAEIMKILSLFFFLIPLISFSQDKDADAIRQVLSVQTDAWNRGNIDEFMKGYWKSDSLKFIGQSGVTYGYDATLARYKRNYSDTAQMGKLSFDILEVKKLSPQYYFVLGKWFLKRSVGDIGGLYTLLFRKINGRWVIVVDHTS